MKVWELMAKLAGIPAGAMVYVMENNESDDAYELVDVECDEDGEWTAWLSGSKPKSESENDPVLKAT